MKKTFVVVLLFFKVIFLTLGGKTVEAMEENIIKINPDDNVLVVFSTEDWEIDENIRHLDLSIGHFANNIEYKNVHEVEQSDLEDKTHLFYYAIPKRNFLQLFLKRFPHLKVRSWRLVIISIN